MRISDWSSDVCSSDLIIEITCLDRLPVEQILDRPVERGVAQFLAPHRPFRPQRNRRVGLGGEDQPRLVLAAWIARLARRRVVRMDQSGRTSGRDRVGQYV